MPSVGMKGYAKIVRRMAGLPNLAICPRVQALRAQDLLYMQAEMVELEQKYRRETSEGAGRSH